MAFSIMLLTMSLILSYLEAVFPIVINQISIKIGLCNIVTLLGFKKIGVKWTLFINILRLIIIGIAFGNLVRFMLSVAGFFLSFIIMLIALYVLKFSTLTVSILGGVFHNIGQIVMLTILMKNNHILGVIPVYLIVGIVAGGITGVITTIIYKKINNISFI